MIINKNTLDFQIRSDKPNENWLEDANYLVIEDNSALAKVFLENYPFIQLQIVDSVITDVIVDIAEKNKASQRLEILQEIDELKKQLVDTDYKAIKYAEGQLTEEEYAPIKNQRQLWRNRINELEEELLK